MKVLVVYGGPNNGLKKELWNHKNQNQLKLNIKNLNKDSLFFINTVNSMLEKQTVAAVDQIEVVARHMSDLKDYLYEHDSILDLVDQETEINKKDKQSDKKTLFDGIEE